YKVSSDDTSTLESSHVNISATESKTFQPTSASISSNNTQHKSTSQPLVYSTNTTQENASTSQPVTNASTNTSYGEDNNKTATIPSIVPSEATTNKTINDSSITSNPKNDTSLNTTEAPSHLLTSKSGTPSSTTQTKTSAELWTSSPSKQSSIECVKIKEVTAHSNAICLAFNETQTCQDYVVMKRNVLEEMFCEKQACHIKLAETNEHHGCNLFVGVNGKGTDALQDILANYKSALTKLGIKTYKKENIESHKDYSRKTLIALVTSGLLLAFLGLAAYHFMKRRSWSSMGERLGEDPYYTENDSHGNPVSSVASHEHSDLQEKPNINGGARENGTGQASSKNGQSGQPHIADTEL
ncbi:Hematopoietic progenitor cell antigen CD34, partial [Varanus komodoensis]